jgi:hypothetical protein
MISQLGASLAAGNAGTGLQRPAADDDERRLPNRIQRRRQTAGTIRALEAVAAMVPGQMRVPRAISPWQSTRRCRKIGAAILWAAVQFDRHFARPHARAGRSRACGAPVCAAIARPWSSQCHDSGLVMSRQVSFASGAA